MEQVKLAKAAQSLLNQVNSKWPNRSKKHDGWVAGKIHWGTVSDHNPKDGWVYGLDIDADLGETYENDPRTSAQVFSDELMRFAREGEDEGRIKYIVHNNRVASGTERTRFWSWKPGKYGALKHIHISFTEEAKDNGDAFKIPIFSPENQKSYTPKKQKEKIKTQPPNYPGKERLTFGMKNPSVEFMQTQLVKVGYALPSGITGEYLSETRDAVKALYHKMRKVSNGDYLGPQAWYFLFKEVE